MLLGLRTVIYQVKDLSQAKKWYAVLLGKQPYFDEPFYVGFDVEGYELGLQPEEDGIQFDNSAKTYWGVTDAKSTWDLLIKNGSIANEPLMMVGQDILIGTVIDPCGNVLGIIENPNFKKVNPDNKG